MYVFLYTLICIDNIHVSQRSNRSFSNHPLGILWDTVILSIHVIWVLYPNGIIKAGNCICLSM